jgi:hypothetical protein
MLSLRAKLVSAISGCALLAAAGCTAPWAASSLASETKSAKNVVPATANNSPQASQVNVASAQPDLAGVLDKLAQVRAIDPAAEQKLLEELRRAPAESWPLVAEQFRASLAYRERLSAKGLNPNREGQTSAEPRVVDARHVSLESPSQSQQPTDLVSRQGRPSAPIGTLVDPRNADSDGVSSEALAKSTPYSTPGAIERSVQPSAPKEFTPTESAYPIALDKQERLGNKNRDIVLARLETDSSARQRGGDAPTAVEADDWEQLVKNAANDLSERVADEPTTTAEIHQHVSLRMLWLLSGETDKALEPIPHISPGEQDYWSRQLFALATYLDHHTQPDDKRRAAASVTHLDEALASLRELGSLTLRNLSFCKKVYGYGAIEPFGREQFSPGQQVSLYVEVENYHSQPTEKGFCTSLGSTYEILNYDGVRITGGEFPDVDDCCRSRRRDFHIQYGLALPEEIAPGRYQLELVVKDRQSDKIGHATAEFEIRGRQR